MQCSLKNESKFISLLYLAEQLYTQKNNISSFQTSIEVQRARTHSIRCRWDARGFLLSALRNVEIQVDLVQVWLNQLLFLIDLVVDLQANVRMKLS